ncbi:MAG: ABC transporter permease [Lachnospiraceae bacterium]|nr:ABC transporter permease [Lachnospiraceae bacterium]
MAKYLTKRIIYSIFSVMAVVVIVMIMVYSLMDRIKVFANDSNYTKLLNNQKITYRYQQWESYGYLDYVSYTDYVNQLALDGEIDEETRSAAVSLGRTADKDSETVAAYVAEFTEYYESQGYTVERYDAVLAGNKVATGGTQILIAYKDVPLLSRIITYFSNLFEFDNIHYVEDDVGERGLTFTLFDPLYGGGKFSPAIIGNGTYHKYLLYFDNVFPYIHQNFLTINLGVSYSVNMGIDVWDTMTQTQGSYVMREVTYETGLTESSADNLHTATYVSGSQSATAVNADRYVDDYTSVSTYNFGKSKMGYSFTMGIIAVIMAYIIGLPLGVLMARYKDGLLDRIGTLYIIFIIAVPSLAYIFMFKAIGGSVFGLPTTFNMESSSKLYYVLPIISLALPSIGNLMKWMRRYMIDQMNSDYVKFARSGGLSETEIFSKHIMKNAAIPIVHGIPGSVLGALTGAIITERVYVVPGAGNLLTSAISAYDNGVIVGVTLFYAVLTVTSIILGDLLMSVVDPRISFTTKDR